MYKEIPKDLKALSLRGRNDRSNCSLGLQIGDCFTTVRNDGWVFSNAYKAITLLLLLSVSCFSQTYEDQISKCLEPLNSEIDPQKDIEQEFETRFNLFRARVKGVSLPNFNVQDVLDNTYYKNDLYGRVTLITYCFADGPCELELNYIYTLAKQFENKDFMIFAFFGDGKELTTQFIKSLKNVKVFANSTEFIQEKLKLTIGYPMHLLINKKAQLIDCQKAISDTSIKQLSKKINQELLK